MTKPKCKLFTKIALGVFYPEDRTGYETEAERSAAYDEIRNRALRTFPGAKGDPVTALCMLVRQQGSVIRAAKARIADAMFADGACGNDGLGDDPEYVKARIVREALS